MPDKYFVYCSELGFSTFSSEEAALEEIHDRIQHVKDEITSEDECSDYYQSICWGVVKGAPVLHHSLTIELESL